MRIATATSLVVILAVAITVVATPWWDRVNRDTFVAYFANTNGLYTGDEVRILGVAVGTVEEIEPQPDRTKVTFSVDTQYPVPADVKAAILSPSLVTARAIQLVPAYSGGPKLTAGATIPQERTAVPVEWDDFRQQLEKLTESLQPTTPGGPSAVGEFINTAADNLRGQGDTARDTVIKLSQAVSALGDHSTDIFSTVRNLQLLVSALSSSSDLLAAFNTNLADVTTVLSNTPNEVADATKGLDGAVNDLRGFVAENREGLGVTVDQLNAITTALNDSRGDVKQILHITPTVFQNFMNIYQPAQSAVTGHPGPRQLRQHRPIHLQRNPGRVAARLRAVVEAVRPVPGADHQEPPVQLPAAGHQPVRRGIGAAQRDHLQRGPAESAPAAAACGCTCRRSTPPSSRCRRKRRARRCAAGARPPTPARACRA